MKKLISGSVPIHYTTTGNGDKTLMFVHGSFIDQSWWNEQVNYFKEHYTVDKLVHLQGTCHFPMIENSSAFNEKLEQVLLAV